MTNKRFQECNWFVKLWRYRFYLLIPFNWCWYHIIAYFKNDSPPVNGRTMWRVLIGAAQCDMNWTYTMEELREHLDDDINYEKRRIN